MAAGMMLIPEDAKQAGALPKWMGYVGVDDVDASAMKATTLGGVVVKEPGEIPGVGRFCVILDPQKAALYLFKPFTPAPDELPPQDAPGLVGWNELYCDDLATVFPFYAELFGWKKTDAVDMAEMGIYQMFGLGDRTLGGMMKRPPNMPSNFWGYYFNVADFDDAIARIGSAGGAVVHGPMQVPGGSWIAQALDPQGVFFSVVGSRA